VLPKLSRRTVLKGVGASIGLPLLEAMMPKLVFGAASVPQMPRRMAFIYVPNGVNMGEWRPSEEGYNVPLSPTLRSLEPYRKELMVLTGLTADKARPNGDGPGDHARAMAAFLTGCQPRKTAGADIRAGISVDQLAAQHLGQATRFPSLEIGCEGGRLAGNCDSGYSCAYSSNISWRSESTPQPKETNPRAVFERLFGNGRGDTGTQAQRIQFQQSILDFVREDAHQLDRQLGSADRRRLDEYLTSIREIERRIQASEGPAPQAPNGMRRPFGIPSDYGAHIRLMGDILALGFQTDLTRIATFVFANEGSNRSYRPINVSEGHHDLSHHGNNAEKLDKIAAINRFHIEQFAYLLGKLKAIREGEGTLLDNCMILYGSGNSDGNRHNHDDLPILLAGKGGGTLRPNRHVRYPRNTPITNLYLSMLKRMGVRIDRFGDSTGSLQDLMV